VDKKVEVYYEQIFKLANYLQHKVEDNLLNTFFHVGLIPYLQAANARTKRDTLFEHKEVVVTYLRRKHGWHKQLSQITWIATKNWKKIRIETNELDLWTLSKNQSYKKIIVIRIQRIPTISLLRWKRSWLMKFPPNITRE
jgi:hypothetical protein